MESMLFSHGSINGIASAHRTTPRSFALPSPASITHGQSFQRRPYFLALPPLAMVFLAAAGLAAALPLPLAALAPSDELPAAWHGEKGGWGSGQQ